MSRTDFLRRTACGTPAAVAIQIELQGGRSFRGIGADLAWCYLFSLAARALETIHEKRFVVRVSG